MTKTSNQLETVFQQITANFAESPGITVIPGEGTPPELYTITYTRMGVCQGSDGEVVPCSTHVISISLPFGFPQFPPDCHPESPTFHPDFDSSVIAIDDAWEADQSIVELIHHIGRMISGEIYSTNDAINKDAAEWYSANRNRLPFSKDTPVTDKSATADTATEPSDSYTVDFLDDEEFEQSFSLEGSAPPTLGMDMDLMRLMAKQKRFHALSKELFNFKDPFDDRSALEEETEKSLQKAMALFQEANELEHQGNHKETLKKLLLIKETVSDDPLLDKALKRAQQASDLLGDWVVENESSPKSSGVKPSPPNRTEAPVPPKARTRSTSPGKGTFFLLLFGGGSLILCAIAIAAFFFVNSNLKQGNTLYRECQQLLERRLFRDAKQRCEEALQLTADVYLIKQEEKSTLDGKINALLSSTTLRQGLAGKTLFNNQYVTQDERQLLTQFTDASKKGQLAFSDENWSEADRSYAQALLLALQTELIPSETISQLREKISRTKIYLAIEEGKHAFADGQWDVAIDQYEMAAKLLAKNSPQLQGINVDETADKLARITLHAVIIRDRQEVAAAIANRKYRQASNKLQNISRTISSSQFADQPQFQHILEEVTSQLANTERQLLIANQARYLTRNYKDIFLNYYPSATRSKLSTPRVEYLRTIDDKLLYRMQCTESAGNKPLRLQMNYIYSPATKKWHFSSEE